MRRQRGIALLTAIVLVALATIIATAIAYQSGMTARRGAAALAYDQSLLAAQAAEAFAGYALSQPGNTSGATNPGGDWAMPLGPVEIVPGVTIEAQLTDATARFNLNNLITATGLPDPAQISAFKELLERRELETTWADKVVDWIDPDVQPLSDGAEDQVYTGLQPAYHPANMMITSVSELLALPGFGRDRYLKLAPYVAALPAGTALNVCTAGTVILDSVLAGQNPGYTQFSASSSAQQIAETRKSACSPTLTQVTDPSVLVVPDANMRASLVKTLSDKTNFYRLTTIVTIGTTQFTLYSLLYQAGGTVTVLARSQTAD